MRQIELLNTEFKRLAFIDKDLEDGLTYTKDDLRTSIEGGIYTLDMTIPKTTGLSQYIQEGYYLTFLNRQGVRVMLTIIEVEDDSEEINIYCEDTSLTLINKVVGPSVEPTRPEGIDYYISPLINGTGWSIGKNESEALLQFSYDGTETLLSRLRKIVADFEMEFYFETEMDYQNGPEFKLNIVNKRIEGIEGFRVSTDDLLDSISRKINIDNLATKVIVVGKENTSSVDSDGVTVVSDATPLSQPTAKTYNGAKASGATRLSYSGYSESTINLFKLNQADPPYVTGSYIDTFLRNYYSDSPLIGYGQYIKDTADYYGVSVGAFLGQIAKETTFGRDSCGGTYNFGCIIWTSNSPFNKKYAGDRYWIDPPSIRAGINSWFHLIRHSYLEIGAPYYSTNYGEYLDYYSPSFENDQLSFKQLMWSVVSSFGYNVTDNVLKVNHSTGSENLQTLDVSKQKSSLTTQPTTEVTIYQTQLDKMIQWFKDRQGRVTYSMSNRGGPYSYDCSSAMYSAFIYSGFKPQGTWLGSTVTMWGEVGSLIKEIPYSDVRRGDIFLSGAKGSASAGSAGHTGVFLDKNTIIHCNYADNGISTTPVSGRSGTPLYCFRLIDKANGATVSNSQTGTVTGGSSSGAVSAKHEQAVQYALNQVGVTPYVAGGTTTKGWDCSGMIYDVFNRAGIPINHRCTTFTMRNGQSPFVTITRGDLKRGDLILYYAGATHVGIYLGNDMLVHSATPALGTIKQNAWSMPVYGYVRVRGG